MRHQRVAKKFGRSTKHRKMLMRSLVTNLILAESIKTTLPKAKEARKDADRIVTVAKKGDLAARRLAASRLVEPKAVQKLFDKIAPAMKDRKGGYTRIVKLGTRRGDAAEMCVLQWVTAAEAAAPAKDEPAKEVK
ncbi:MAG: 50S ribosomal protein L17 [Kiritimatiellae bacterium]|jgi:large subunit ribosomal protein L17|nr:50S ribosomal protein L17 [Kiritimatiellia bacterium]MBR2354786.1 50S ribosomal protein L17 [Kiritimatiellia bacterium]MBR2939412.1 50S ribosomal protein L17 [Kiritimatiellia bacterium]